MMILAASDVHGNHETYRWLVSLAGSREVELLVLAGDLLGFDEQIEETEASQAADAARVVAILSEIRVPVFYIMGNDDWVGIEPPDERFQFLHGRRIERGGFNFVGYQFTLPFMGGVN